MRDLFIDVLPGNVSGGLCFPPGFCVFVQVLARIYTDWLVSETERSERRVSAGRRGQNDGSQRDRNVTFDREV